MPSSVQHVALRSHAAGYQVELLKYGAEGKNALFGVIDFAVSADVSPEFRKAALAADVTWRPLDEKGDQEYAQVAFVPHWIVIGAKNAPTYRFLAIREVLRQIDLPSLMVARLWSCCFELAKKYDR